MLQEYAENAAFIALYLVLFLCAKWTKQVLVPYSIDEQLTRHDNPAVALSMCGYYGAHTAIFVGALLGPTRGIVQDLVAVSGYTALGLVFLHLSRYVNDHLILKYFCNVNQLIRERNVAVGAVECGSYLATGLIAAGAVHGVGGGVHTALVFFLLGQCSLWAFSRMYDVLTPYSLHEELNSRNVAVGVALGGNLAALGLIIFGGIKGDFIGWKANLTDWALANVMAFIFLPTVRYVTDKLALPKSPLNDELARDRNIGAGLLEATFALGSAVLLATLW